MSLLSLFLLPVCSKFSPEVSKLNSRVSSISLILKPKEKESDFAKEILIKMNVNQNNILIEPNSRNTYENAKFSSELLLNKYGAGGKYLLITSAFHMRRAEACFNKTELDIDVLKVDFQVDTDDYTLTTFILPSATVLDKWQVLFREWVGIFFYWLRGYL